MALMITTKSLRSENSVAEEAVAEAEAEVVAKPEAPVATKAVSTDDFYEVVDDDE